MYEGLAGLGKGAAESAFDSGRQNLWNEFVAIHAQIDPAIASGRVAPDLLAGVINQTQSIIARHRTLYDTAKAAGVSTSWLDPRFGDFETPFESDLRKWQAMAATVSTSTLAPTNTVAMDPSGTQLIIRGTSPAGIPAASTAQAGAVTGSPIGDLFGPSIPPAQQAGFDIGGALPWIAGGLAVAWFLSRK